MRVSTAALILLSGGGAVAAFVPFASRKVVRYPKQHAAHASEHSFQEIGGILPPIFPSPKVTSETPIISQLSKNQNIMEARSYLLEIEMAAEKAREYVAYLGNVAAVIRDLLGQQANLSNAANHELSSPHQSANRIVLENVKEAQDYLVNVEKAEASAVEYLEHLEDMARRTKAFLSKFEDEYNKAGNRHAASNTQVQQANEAQSLYRDLEEEARAAKDYLDYLKKAAASLQQFLMVSPSLTRQNDKDETNVGIPSVLPADAQALCGLEGFQEFVVKKQKKESASSSQIHWSEAKARQPTTSSTYSSLPTTDATATSSVGVNERKEPTLPGKLTDSNLLEEVPRVNGAATESPQKVPQTESRTKQESNKSSSSSSEERTSSPKRQVTSTTASYLDSMTPAAAVPPKTSSSPPKTGAPHGRARSPGDSGLHDVSGVTSDSLLPRNGATDKRNGVSARVASSSTGSTRNKYLDQVSTTTARTSGSKVTARPKRNADGPAGSAATKKSYIDTMSSSAKTSQTSSAKTTTPRQASSKLGSSYLDRRTSSSTTSTSSTKNNPSASDWGFDKSNGDGRVVSKLGGTGKYLDQMSKPVDESRLPKETAPSTTASFLDKKLDTPRTSSPSDEKTEPDMSAPLTSGSHLGQAETATASTDNPTSSSTGRAISTGGAADASPGTSYLDQISSPTAQSKATAPKLDSAKSTSYLDRIASAVSNDPSPITSGPETYEPESSEDNLPSQGSIEKVVDLGTVAHPGTKSYMQRMSPSSGMTENEGQTYTHQASGSFVDDMSPAEEIAQSSNTDIADSSTERDSPQDRAMGIGRIAHPGTRSFVERKPTSVPPRKAKEVETDVPPDRMLVTDPVNSADEAPAADPAKRRKTVLNYMKDLIRGRSAKADGAVDETTCDSTRPESSACEPSDSPSMAASQIDAPAMTPPTDEAKESITASKRRSVLSYLEDATMPASDRRDINPLNMETYSFDDAMETSDSGNSRSHGSVGSTDPSRTGTSSENAYMGIASSTRSTRSRETGVSRTERGDVADASSATDMRGRPLSDYGCFSLDWPPTNAGNVDDSISSVNGDYVSSPLHADTAESSSFAAPTSWEMHSGETQAGGTDMRGNPLSDYGFSDEWPPTSGTVDDGIGVSSVHARDGSSFLRGAAVEGSSAGGPGLSSSAPRNPEIPHTNLNAGGQSGGTDMRGRPLSDYGFSAEWPPKMCVDDDFGVTGNVPAKDGSSYGGGAQYSVSGGLDQTPNANADLGRPTSSGTDMRGRPLSDYGFSDQWPPTSSDVDTDISGAHSEYGPLSVDEGALEGSSLGSPEPSIAAPPTAEMPPAKFNSVGPSGGTDMRGRPLSDYGFSAEWPPKMVVDDDGATPSNLHGGQQGSLSTGFTDDSDVRQDLETKPGVNSGTGGTVMPKKRLVFKGFSDTWPYKPIMGESDDDVVDGNVDVTAESVKQVDSASSSLAGASSEKSSDAPTKGAPRAPRPANVSDGTHNFRGFSKEWPPKMFLSEYDNDDGVPLGSADNGKSLNQSKPFFSAPKGAKTDRTSEKGKTESGQGDATTIQEQSLLDTKSPSADTEESNACKTGSAMDSSRSPGFVGFAADWPPQLVVNDDSTSMDNGKMTASNAYGNGDNSFSAASDSESAAPPTPEVGSKYGLPRSTYVPEASPPTKTIATERDVSTAIGTERRKASFARQAPDSAANEKTKTTSPVLDNVKSTIKSHGSLKGPPKKTERPDFHSDQTVSSRPSSTGSPPRPGAPKREDAPTPLQVTEPGSPRCDPSLWSRAFNSLNSMASDERLRFMAEQYVYLLKKQLGYPKLITMKSLNGAAVPETWEKYVEEQLHVTPDVRQEVVRMQGTASDVVAFLYANANSERRKEKVTQSRPHAQPPPAKPLEEDSAPVSTPIRVTLADPKGKDVSSRRQQSETPSSDEKPRSSPVQSKENVSPLEPEGESTNLENSPNLQSQPGASSGSATWGKKKTRAAHKASPDSDESPNELRGVPSTEIRSSQSAQEKTSRLENPSLSEASLQTETTNATVEFSAMPTTEKGSVITSADEKLVIKPKAYSTENEDSSVADPTKSKPRRTNRKNPSFSEASLPIETTDATMDSSAMPTTENGDVIPSAGEKLVKKPKAASKEQEGSSVADPTKSKPRRTNRKSSSSKQKKVGNVNSVNKPETLPTTRADSSKMAKAPKKRSVDSSISSKQPRASSGKENAHVSSALSKKHARSNDSRPKARLANVVQKHNEQKAASLPEEGTYDRTTSPPFKVSSNVSKNKDGSNIRHSSSPVKKGGTARASDASARAKKTKDVAPAPAQESLRANGIAPPKVTNGTAAPNDSVKAPTDTSSARGTTSSRKVSSAKGKSSETPRGIGDSGVSAAKVKSLPKARRIDSKASETRPSLSSVVLVDVDDIEPHPSANGTPSPSVSRKRPPSEAAPAHKSQSPHLANGSKKTLPTERVSVDAAGEAPDSEVSARTTKATPRANGRKLTPPHVAREKVVKGKTSDGPGRLSASASNTTEVAEAATVVEVAADEATTAPEDYLDPLESMLKVFGMKLPWSSDDGE